MPSGSSIHISVRPQGSAAGSRMTGTPAGQPGVLGADIPYLDPDHHRAPGRAVRVPGDLEQPRAEEEHHPRIVGGTELPVDGQAQQVAVEAAAAVQVAGPQQDPAAQNVHATISASR
jgi:hypothetical protein